MRVIIIKQATDWAALAPQVVASGGDSAQALARLQRANPHLDFQKLGDGAVVLVPEQPGLKTDANDSLAGAAFGALQRQFNDAVAATTADARAGWAAVITEQREVGVALKRVANLVGADPDLKAQAEQAMAAAQAAAASAKTADAAYKSLESQCTAELAGLARLLGASSGSTPTPAPTPPPAPPVAAPPPSVNPGSPLTPPVAGPVTAPGLNPAAGPAFGPGVVPVVTPAGTPMLAPAASPATTPRAVKPKAAPKGKR